MSAVVIDGEEAAAIRSRSSWQDDLVDTTGIEYQYEYSLDDPLLLLVSPPLALPNENESESESFIDQLKGFFKASGEMVKELGKGCKDVVHQSIIADSYLLTKFTCFAHRFTFLNDFFLPEDRHPLHAWPLIFLVFILALSVLCVNTQQPQHSLPTKVHVHPPTAALVQLPDGRHMAYHQQGVQAQNARFTLISPHSFLSSRLSGIPGIKESLLQEFGVCFITYDIPGFGETAPHPNRNLNTSAMDMLHLAAALGVNHKFWVVAYSAGAMHAWAALTYIPDRLAGAAMFAPLVNPYDFSMTKAERYRIWEKWTRRRKLLYFLARRFPSFLGYFYRRSFLSGEHGQLDEWLSVSLGEKDRILIAEPIFKEFWQRDVEESLRQGLVRPFVEEASLQVSQWGFSLADIRVQRKRQKNGILPWLKSMYSRAELDWEGFLGPIHIWQGMEDEVTTPSSAEFIRRIIPGSIVHKVEGEGHFSYFYFCDECHRQILSTLFGKPRGPLNNNSTVWEDETSIEAEEEEGNNTVL